MHVAIIFASTEGQTRKIAQFVQATLVGLGAHTTLVSADAATGMDFTPFEGVITAASIHAGRYQPEFLAFAKAHAEDLKARPTLFLSVSLAAAGDAYEDWADLDRIVERMTDETGFRPKRVEQVAGAFRFEHYGFVKYWAVRWIEAKKDPEAVPGEDKEYTDWDAVAAKVGDWTAGLSAGT